MTNSLELILWLQSVRGPALEAFGRLFNFLGTEDFFMIAVPIIYWCVDALLGRRMFVLLIISVWGGNWLKSWWQLPRPFQASDEVQPLLIEESYGLPSVHTMNAAVLAGSLAYHLKRRWVTALVILYVLFTGLARMISGVHFLEDAVSGLIIGFLLLFVFQGFGAGISEWLRRLNVGFEVLLTLLAAAALFLIHPLLVPADMLTTWEQTYTALGLLLGVGIALALEDRYVRFSAGGPLWKRAARFLLGFVGILILRFGLGAAFENLEPEALFRVLRYALIGLWGVLGAPWLFVRFKLAERREELVTAPVEAESALMAAPE
jgi:hypothetical protein